MYKVLIIIYLITLFFCIESYTKEIYVCPQILVCKNNHCEPELDKFYLAKPSQKIQDGTYRFHMAWGDLGMGRWYIDYEPNVPGEGKSGFFYNSYYWVASRDAPNYWSNSTSRPDCLDDALYCPFGRKKV